MQGQRRRRGSGAHQQVPQPVRHEQGANVGGHHVVDAALQQALRHEQIWFVRPAIPPAAVPPDTVTPRPEEVLTDAFHFWTACH